MQKQVDLDNITILDFVYELTKKYGSNPALQVKDKNQIQTITYDELRERSVGASAFLIEKGVEPKSHIAILTENRPEWAISFFGIMSSACVTVPVDAKLSITETLFILNDSGAQVLFTSGKMLKAIMEVREQLPAIKHIVCMDPCEHEGVYYLNDLQYREGQILNRPADVKSADTALIVYTSGTTGVAKGVELSWNNILFEAITLYRMVGYTSQDSMISILPLNHMLEITGGLIAPLYGGATITYCPSFKPAQIIFLMQEVKATCMICVPLVLKMFYNGILKETDRLKGVGKILFKMMLGLSKTLLKLDIRVGGILFKKIKSKFGKNFKYFLSGGAPLDIGLEKDFDVLGFRILQGYGLTETAPVVCLNTLEDHRYGSVGKPLGDVEIKLVKNSQDKEEGEILIKGPNVMKGYYRSPEKTAEVLKDEWYYTGDLGYFDKDGFLYICGRSKNLIVLGAGKKVFPEEVEQVMSESLLIKEICVLGRKATSGLKQGTEEVFAVVVPDLDRFDEKDKQRVKEKISEVINKQSEHLAEYKKISDFMIYNDELPKTSTRKVKRKEVVVIIEEGQGQPKQEVQYLNTAEYADDEVSEEVRALVASELSIDKGKIKTNSYLDNDLGIDSLQKVELLAAIEQKLGFEIPEEIAYEIATFEDLVRFVKEYKAGRKDLEVDWKKEADAIMFRKKVFWCSRFANIIFLRVFSKLYFRLSIKGRSNLPEDTSFILSANHSSHLDFPLLFSSLPLGRSMKVVAPAAADYFYKNKFRRTLMEVSLNTFPFQRIGNFVQSLKLCKELIKKGNSLILFPEGTRSGSDQLAEFKPGVAAIAYGLNIPIIPVYIDGALDALPKGSLFVRPKKIIINIGKPIYPKGEAGYGQYQDMIQELKKAIIKLKKGE